MPPVKVCLIGAGPSGMSVLYHVEQMRRQSGATKTGDLPELTCYEKQADWGGQWNYTWRTGLDEFGENIPCSMYRDLWTNVPKEVMEYQDYSFYEHFGKAVPSFVPREAMLHYMAGRWARYNLKPQVSFLHSVQQVTFDEARNKFNVSVKDLTNDRLIDNQQFDYVVNCTGHFSVPNVPSYKGIEQFPGRVLHSHDLREWSEFAGQRVLVIGGSFSAEDAALQLIKHGASQTVISCRTQPMPYKWPAGVTQRPALVELDGQVARFQDGASAEIDVIIMCTGYLHHYPYLSDSLRLTGKNLLYPGKLYKCIVWLGGGNNRMLYIGAQYPCYSLPMYDAQALWVVKYIRGDIKLPGRAAMEAEIQKWQERQATLKDAYQYVDFQTDGLVDLANEAGYGKDVNSAKLFHAWLRHKEEDVLTFRDRSFASRISGTAAADRAVPFMDRKSDSLESFLANKK